MAQQHQNDLNDIIATAVNARIEASVAEALSGDKLLQQYVAAAMAQPVEVKDQYSYSTRKSTFLMETITKTVQEATKAAVTKLIQDEAPALEAAVATELKRASKEIAKQLVGSLADTAKSGYGISISMNYPSR